jgi:hypothetical protein
MEPPLVQAFLLCEQVIADERTHRKSLINIFHQLQARTFPFVLSRVAVFASLINGNGLVDFEVRCVKEDDSKIIFTTRGPIHFVNPNAVVELVLELNVVFPTSGAYSFLLFCGEDLLAERRFYIQPALPPAPPHAPSAG